MSSASTDQALLDQLTEALSGLTWVSETDAPFDVVLWETWDKEESDQQELAALPSEAQFLKRAQLPPETPVKQRDLKTFLDPVIHPIYPPEYPAVPERFQAVEDILLQNLQQIRVYRCGIGEIELYILGRTPNGGWIVLHTTAVET